MEQAEKPVKREWCNISDRSHLLEYQPGICPRPTPLQNGDEVVLIPPVISPLLPSDSPPMAISLSPGGRSS
ncbi:MULTISPECIES: hypothetical protein [unclassified Microcoleus]|uniref:hypothetical protein n=1 Tax=unclassified Microcoleus TaxID=2642155 RepID=UPI002FD556AA